MNNLNHLKQSNITVKQVETTETNKLFFNNRKQSKKNQKTTWTDVENPKEPTSNLHTTWTQPKECKQRGSFQNNLTQFNTTLKNNGNHIEQNKKYSSENEANWTTEVDLKIGNKLKQLLNERNNRDNVQQLKTTEKDPKQNTTFATLMHTA